MICWQSNKFVYKLHKNIKISVLVYFELNFFIYFELKYLNPKLKQVQSIKSQLSLEHVKKLLIVIRPVNPVK